MHNPLLHVVFFLVSTKMHLCHKIRHVYRSIHRASLLIKQQTPPLPQSFNNIDQISGIRTRHISTTSRLTSKLPENQKNDDFDSSKEGPTELNIPVPEFDFDYLCDPLNREEIRENIINRKGVGDIDKVVSKSLCGALLFKS